MKKYFILFILLLFQFYVLVFPCVASFASNAPVLERSTIFTYADRNRFANEDFLDDKSEHPNVPKPSFRNYITLFMPYGVTIYSIALKYNTTVEQIAYVNNIRNINSIYPGKILKIPVFDYNTSARIYIVRNGDSLLGISKKLGVSIGRIIMLNRIYIPNLLSPGNVLHI